VQGVLASRIDRLGPQEKKLLQALAVIGKEFSLGLLKKVVEQPEEELCRLLSHLQATEFIYEQPAFPEIEYTFKHALTQEVAYKSVLMGWRRVLHERAAQAIEEIHRSGLEDHYSQLAHHYSCSGNAEKAVEYLQLSGQQAMQRSAHAEAIAHFTKGLEILKTLPDIPQRAQQELRLQIALGTPLQAIKGPAASEVEQVYMRACELCQQIGETPQLFSVLQGLWLLYHVRAELQTARELGERLLSIAQRVQEPAFLLEAHRALGSTLLWLGEFPLARAHLEQASALYDLQPHPSLAFLHGGVNPRVTCLSEVARALWFLGYPDQALRKSQEALTLAQELSDPFNLGFALLFAAGIHQLRREGQAVQERAEVVIALATEQGFTSLLSAGTIRRGWALAEQGQEEEGMAQMHQGLVARRAAGAELAQPYFLTLQAEVYRKVGQIEQGLTVLTQALAAVNNSGERRFEAELHRLKGELLLAQEGKSEKAKGKNGKESEAEECFHRAIDIARRQSAKSLELRAVMSLSHLWQSQGKKAEARQILAEIYGWFTEGFDTADLKEAKVILAELEG
jgi:predicted ATPase